MSARDSRPLMMSAGQVSRLRLAQVMQLFRLAARAICLFLAPETSAASNYSNYNKNDNKEPLLSGPGKVALVVAARARAAQRDRRQVWCRASRTRVVPGQRCELFLANLRAVFGNKFSFCRLSNSSRRSRRLKSFRQVDWPAGRPDSSRLRPGELARGGRPSVTPIGLGISSNPIGFGFSVSCDLSFGLSSNLGFGLALGRRQDNGAAWLRRSAASKTGAARA